MEKQNNETKRPTHAILAAIGDGKRTRWHRVGAAWPNKDGKGFNLVFDSFPLAGRVVLREITEQDEANGGQQ